MKKNLILVLAIVLIIGLLIFSFIQIKESISENEENENIANVNISSNENTSENNKEIELKDNEDSIKTATIIEEKENEKEEVKEENNNETSENENNIVNEDNNKEKTKNENAKRKTIVIDPGHQAKGDNTTEPIGPGASEKKAKVTTGATGTYTKQTESELVLDVSLSLKEELEKEGYNVIMTRTTNDVNISNSQRAKIANDAKADAFIRIHADSYSDSSVNGMSTLCQTSSNKYNGDLADESYNLSKKILDNMAKITGAKNRGVTKTDTMSGINWSEVPVTIIEMGFLSNEKEDKLLASTEYQGKIITGIVNGLNEYFK